jgi:nitrite reductase (NADH) large subunit
MTETPQKAWICKVCGYVHYGPEPPAECPVCGVDASEFEPYIEKTTQKAWICKVCGYIHYGSEPPAECPVCGADASEFELMPATTAAPEVKTSTGTGMTVVIVGAGIAGVSAAAELRKTSPNAGIILVSNENELPYYRISLTHYLAGDIKPDQFAIHPENWYADQQIDLRLGVEVTSINPVVKTVTLSSGDVLDYDRLVLTPGSRPFVPPISGTNLTKVYTLRTRRDADKILADCKDAQVVCIGGGLLGLEAASALVRRGANVTVLETLNWLIPRQLNKKAAGIFQEFVERLGIRVQTAVKITELHGEGSVDSVVLDDGTTIPADMVIISAGVRSNTSLANQAGIKVNQGIQVDEYMRTSQPAIYSAGDSAEHNGVLYGTWAPALAQGIIAGASAVKESMVFKPLPRSIVLKVLGIDLFSAGSIAPGESDTLIEKTGTDLYQGFVFHENCISGAILLGDASASSAVKKAIEEHLDCAALLSASPDADDVLKFILEKTPQG